jgi:hypothetical protein
MDRSALVLALLGLLVLAAACGGSQAGPPNSSGGERRSLVQDMTSAMKDGGRD